MPAITLADAYHSKISDLVMWDDSWRVCSCLLWVSGFWVLDNITFRDCAKNWPFQRQVGVGPGLGLGPGPGPRDKPNRASARDFCLKPLQAWVEFNTLLGLSQLVLTLRLLTKLALAVSYETDYHSVFSYYRS
jgi:hypothetical protein